jgi:predicted HTH transcriptional regulator
VEARGRQGPLHIVDQAISDRHASAAFNNGYGTGGKLIIGVDDDRNVLGLENDYATLKGGDRDAFEIHLHSLISAEFGIEYAAANVKITFCEVAGQDVCLVDIACGSKPLFVEMADKSGAKEKKFFVRSGNASPPVAHPSEISSYIVQRFG